MAPITQERVRELFNYDANIGALIRAVDHVMTKAGERPGCVSSDSGYRLLNVDGKLYREHRLIWLYVYGEFPVGQIDHINGVRDDNRISNLRDVSDAENKRNTKKRRDNTSGVTGVYHRPETNGWRAIIYIDGKSVGLGHYKLKKDAVNARREAERKYGFHENHGRR